MSTYTELTYDQIDRLADQAANAIKYTRNARTGTTYQYSTNDKNTSRQQRKQVKAKALPQECKITGEPFAQGRDRRNGISRDNVRATYHYYAPHYETSTLACADRFWADPRHGAKLLDLPWTAYCLDRKFSQSVCGKCLRVTSRRTGASVLVRAVDNGGCSDVDGTGLDLDPCAFNAIDTDGQGVRDGNMRVDVREVQCARPF